MGGKSEAQRPVHDRALLLHGPKRNEVLTLDEVEQYGRDDIIRPRARYVGTIR